MPPVHKITNVPVFYMVLGLNDSDAGKIITRATGKSGPENLEFWAQIALASLVAISWPKKVSIFRAHQFQWAMALEMVPVP
jgi:hypothetical protein